MLKNKLIYKLYAGLLTFSLLFLSTGYLPKAHATKTPFPPTCSSPSLANTPFSNNWLADAKAYADRAITEGGTPFSWASPNDLKFVFFKNNEIFNTNYRLVVLAPNVNVKIKGVGNYVAGSPVADSTIELTLSSGSNGQFLSIPYGTDPTNFKLSADRGFGGFTGTKTWTDVECIEFATTNVTIENMYRDVSKVLPYAQNTLGLTGTPFEVADKKALTVSGGSSVVTVSYDQVNQYLALAVVIFVGWRFIRAVGTTRRKNNE